MARIEKFNVLPNLPDKLAPLMKISTNLWWVWNYEAIDLFRRLNVDLWRDVGHNPIKMLGLISQDLLEEAAESESFIAHMERVEKELDWHLNRKTWFSEEMSEICDSEIAYFSAEFGIHECLRIYSGGLGILAGDHLKSASELGIPLVGVGMLYRLGYFSQYLNLDGWQQERFPETDFYNIPVAPVEDENGGPVIISVEYPGRDVFARVWEVKVGRVHLYLLDTNIEQNSLSDRTITDQLYGGDLEMRIKQEILLGIGGVRLLRKLNKNISVYHMNEGHAAFLSIERIASSMVDSKLSFDEAHAFVTATDVFTTHTPVPAGNDRFPPELIETYFSHYYGMLGLSSEQFMALGRENPDDHKETFCMTVLAMKTSALCNGVSKLHGKVSRKMWQGLWPSLPLNEVPIDHITNGIQTLSWTSDEMMRLLNRYLGPRWIDTPTDSSIWKNIDDIPDSELWRCRERLRERLVAFARKKLNEQLRSRGLSPKIAERANSVLNPDALTIGFARRFATYKRATLLMRDLERLGALLNNRNFPVQIIFAGKAHPKDNMGKELIRQVIHLNNDERFRNSIVFIEDYDINIARYLVQGVDVWLNTPIRPKEASGTSGMKVVPNGGLNISVLDGWWDEAYNTENGWAIGKGEEYDDLAYQDDVESLSLYNILEHEVIPAFYDRGIDGIPREWLKKIRESMKTNNSVFNTNRMVKDYTEKFYCNAHKNHETFSDNNYQVARDMAEWEKRVVKHLGSLKIEEIYIIDQAEITVGTRVRVRAEVTAGKMQQEDLLIELYFGAIDQHGEIYDGAALPMSFIEKNEQGRLIYEGQMLCLTSGQFGYTVRGVPRNDNMPRKFYPGMKLIWAQG